MSFKPMRNLSVLAAVAMIGCVASAQTSLTQRKPATDSTGNKSSAVSNLVVPSGGGVTAGQVQDIFSNFSYTSVVNNTLPAGYVERTITQNLGPYFVAPGLAYPYENQVSYVAAVVATTCNSYSGSCGSAAPSNVTAQSFCGGNFDGHTASVPPVYSIVAAGNEIPQGGPIPLTTYLNGMSPVGYVSQISQVVCAPLGTRTVTTLEKASSSTSPTVALAPANYEALRQSLGVNVIGTLSANQVCVWAGYPKGLVAGTVVNGGSFYTCGNNTVGTWNGTAWVSANACAENSKLMGVTCYK